MNKLTENKIPKSIFDEDFGEDHVGFCNGKNIDRLFELNKGAVYIPDCPGNLKFIPVIRQTRLELIGVPDPKGAWIEHLNEYSPNYKTEIHPSVHIPSSTKIYLGTIIEEGVEIGENCVIGSHGFGYHNGKLIPHKGRVIIKKNARICNNVCIDRDSIGETIIGEDVKIDNLVHIAHGVKIGKGSYIIAGAVICGSVKIGENCWIAPHATIHQHLKIGDNSTVGLGAVVIRDVPANTTVAGCPAKRIVKNH